MLVIVMMKVTHNGRKAEGKEREEQREEVRQGIYRECGFTTLTLQPLLLLLHHF